jgi:hypothetical protein
VAEGIAAGNGDEIGEGFNTIRNSYNPYGTGTYGGYPTPGQSHDPGDYRTC